MKIEFIFGIKVHIIVLYYLLSFFACTLVHKLIIDIEVPLLIDSKILYNKYCSIRETIARLFF